MAERLIALGFMEDVLERFPVSGQRCWRGSVRAFATKLGSAGFGAYAEPVSGEGPADAGRG